MDETDEPRSAKRSDPALHTITPHMMVPDAAVAAAWYSRAFGAEERARVPLPGGAVLTIVMGLGDSEFHIASGLSEVEAKAPTTSVLQIVVDDADSARKRAVDAGAVVEKDLADQFWGERHGALRDPYGHRWNIAQHLRDVPEEEIAAAAAEAYGSGD